ncbi:MAG TPA: hypothetical protein VGE45_13580 [Chloroflexia bacterium]
MGKRTRQQEKQSRERTRSKAPNQRKKDRRAKNQSRLGGYLLRGLVWLWHNHIWFGYALAAFSLVYMFGWLWFLPERVATVIFIATLVYWFLFVTIWRWRGFYMMKWFDRDRDPD